MTRPNPRSGIALMVVLFSLLFMSIISYEIIYSSRVDLRISANARNRIQAWYMAKSAARFALMRLHIYQRAKNTPALKQYAALIDKVWSFPLPSFPLPGQVYGEDHQLPGEMTSLIKSEGSLIPINLLDANVHRNSSEEIAKEVREQIEHLIESLQEDDVFAENYRDLRPEDLIDPLVDWIDEDTDSSGAGGDELSDYDDFDPPYEPRNDRIPVLSEIHMIKNWNDDLFNRLAPEFSVIKNEMKVNPNYITLKRLKSFHPRLSDEDLRMIEERRREEPFASLEQLEQFIQSSPDVKNGSGFEFPFEFKSSDTETVFRIEASGIVGFARRVIRLGVRLEEKEVKNRNRNEGGGQQKRNQKRTRLAPPKVVSFEVVV